MSDRDERDDAREPDASERAAEDATSTREPAPAPEREAPAPAPEPASANAVNEAADAHASAATSDDPAPAAPPAPAPRAAWWHERSEVASELPRRWLASHSRRSFLAFGAGALAAATGAWLVLPDRVRSRLLPPPAHDALDTLAARAGWSAARRERVLNRALTFDDDVAEALYSRDRLVRTYDRSQVTPLRNNYDGRTPGPEILRGWSLALDGLAAGRPRRLTLPDLLARFRLRGQVTRFVCVEGWSAIAWWGGVAFADFLVAFPPAPDARWAAFRSDVNLDRQGRSRPYYVSLDLDTLRHPQTLLATHHDGRPLSLEHGAPLRLRVPVKLGLKNIKAITSITYTASEPPDYWNERGYSKYDGI